MMSRYHVSMIWGTWLRLNRWYGTHQPCFHNIHHVFTIWSSTVQDLKTWSCTTKLRQHDVSCTHKTICCWHDLHVWTHNTSCQRVHKSHIMSTWYHIHEHVKSICLCVWRSMSCWHDLVISWFGWHDLVSGWHEFLFHVNSQIAYHVNVDMLSWMEKIKTKFVSEVRFS